MVPNKALTTLGFTVVNILLRAKSPLGSYYCMAHACYLLFKAALLSIFILTIDQMAMFNMKGVTDSEEPIENYYLTVRLLSY